MGGRGVGVGGCWSLDQILDLPLEASCIFFPHVLTPARWILPPRVYSNFCTRREEPIERRFLRRGCD